MKARDLRQESNEQLDLILKETQIKLFRLRLQSETEKLKAASDIRVSKTLIARVKTIQRLRQLGRESAAF